MSHLKLYSGNDIPFPEARLSVHQPTIREIAWVGEQRFFTGCEILNFSKDKFLNEKDKLNSINQTNFDVFIVMMKTDNPQMKKYKNCAKMVLSLLFPNCTVTFADQEIILKEEDEVHYINNKNFEKFKFIISKIFCTQNRAGSSQDYNPQGDQAKRIAEQLRKGREKAAAQKGGGNNKISIFAKYISVLSTGQNISVQELLDYTVFQLYDAFHRFNLKQNFDSYVQQCLAGAKDVKKVDYWMEDIDLDKINKEENSI